MSRAAIICISVFVVVVSVILLVTLLPFSFKRIALDEVGLKYHTISKKLYTDEVFGQGNHYVQPGEKFFIFKSRFVSINFLKGELKNDPLEYEEPRNYGNIICITNDGLTLDMQVTAQYILRIQEVPTLFLKFGESYEKIFSSMIRSGIRDTCGSFNASEFYTDRGGVQILMLNLTQERLAEAHADIGFLQLSNVQFPSRYEAAVSAKEEARASVDQARAQREEALIASRTQVEQARQQADVKRVQAQREADAIVSSAIIDANSTIVELETQSEVYRRVMDAYGFTPQELINFISIENLNSIDDLLIGTKAPGQYSFPVEP